MLKTKVIEELKYIDKYFDHSPGCSDAMKFYIASNGLVIYIDKNILLTDQAQLMIGYLKEDIGLVEIKSPEEDITEAFLYMNEGEYNE